MAEPKTHRNMPNYLLTHNLSFMINLKSKSLTHLKGLSQSKKDESLERGMM